MLKVTHAIILLCFCITLTACSILDTKKNFSDGHAQWDFDHNVQFRQTKLSSNNYRLEIISTKKVNFERLATFLLRQSYNLCHHYGYTLKILQGVEGFDDKFTAPSRILPSLIAKVNCSEESE